MDSVPIEPSLLPGEEALPCKGMTNARDPSPPQLQFSVLTVIPLQPRVFCTLNVFHCFSLPALNSVLSRIKQTSENARKGTRVTEPRVPWFCLVLNLTWTPHYQSLEILTSCWSMLGVVSTHIADAISAFCCLSSLESSPPRATLLCSGLSTRISSLLPQLPQVVFDGYVEASSLIM